MTADEIWPGIFRIEVPLPGNPLKAINSYLVRGIGRSLLIDTGMYRHECLEAIETGLERLAVPLERVDFFITHFHPDHVGLVPKLLREGALVYIGRRDGEVLREPDRWEKLARGARLNGFSEEDLQEVMADFPGRNHPGVPKLDFTFLGDGDRLCCGPYVFSCVETPGHSRGQLCLFEADAKILFSGDHVLGGITPNISAWSYDGDPLREYLESLDKVSHCDCDWVFPGHRAPFRGLVRRVAQIKKHHEVRTEEVVSLLTSKGQTALDVASRMTWGIRCSSWEAVPSFQKWFAGGEALAHLEYLRGKGRVERQVCEGKALFSLTQKV